MSKALDVIKTKVSLVLGVLILIFVFTLTGRSNDPGDTAINNVASPIASLSSGAVLSLEVAESDSDRIRGLSGRESLSEGTGLLFIFDTLGQHGIWMKNMNFPIDIIWLDKDFMITGLKENAIPDSYPEIFLPEKAALYVIEVNTGFIQENGLRIGDHFDVEL